MKLFVYKPVGSNTGKLKKTKDSINLKKNNWIDKHGTSHPLVFKKIKAFDNKEDTYVLAHYGQPFDIKPRVTHVCLNFFQKPSFSLLQNMISLQQGKTWLWVTGVLISLGIFQKLF